MNLSRLDAVAEELSATRAEVIGLAVLLCGGVIVAWLAVRQAPGRPSPVDAAVTVATPSATPIAPFASEADGAPRAASPQPPAQVVVHVTGAVRQPGVVTLPTGARGIDALTAAGGMKPTAASDALNLARVLSDGEHLHVPTRNEVEAGTWTPRPSTTGQTAGQPTGPIDLNTATQGQLETLPGVGPVLAQRILQWRDTNSGFTEVGQLREVSGIGEATFQSLASLVTVT